MQKFYTLTLAGKFILPVAIGGVLLILLVVAGLILVQEQNTERAGLNTAQSLAHQITTLRTVYTTQVLSRAKEAGLEAPYDFESRENTLPETFIRALGEQMAEDFPGMSVRLYSRNPDRVAQEPYDAFERYAIEELENDAETPVYRIEEVHGRRSMRYAIADVIGDVQGVVEVIVPLDDLDAGLQASSIQLGLGILAGVLLLMVMVLLVLRRAVMKPVAALRDAAQAVSTGDLDTEIEVRSADEVGGLAQVFNEMVATIRETAQALQVEKLRAQEALTQAEQARRSSEQEKQYLAGSIDYMLEQIGRFAEGNLTVRLDADRDDEIARLYEGFNSAVENVHELFHQVNQAVQSTSAMAHQMSRGAEQLAAGLQQQSSQTHDVAAAAEEMARTIIENAGNAARTAEAAANSGAIAKESGEIVEQTISKIWQIAEVVGESTETVERLGASSTKIGEIIAVIDEIADQTNLLALNAAIEAARAGEQGRGFAVVADEVRKLAERTTQATKQIAGMIQTIQTETKQAVEAMQLGRAEVTEGIRLADSAGSSLRRVVSETKGVVGMISQIASATQEQSTTSEQISRSVEAISTITGESTNGIAEIARSSDRMNQVTKELRILMARFTLDETAATTSEPFAVGGDGYSEPIF